MSFSGSPEGRNLDRYKAEAFCGNCQYLGPVYPVVGQKVHTELCPVCRASSVMPSHASHASVARYARGEDTDG